MDVKVVDGLAAVGAAVDDDAIAVRQSFGARDFRGCEKQMAEQARLILGGVSERGYVLARNDEEVRGRLRVDVRERDALLVLMNEVCGYRSFNNFAEQASHIGISVQARAAHSVRV